MRRENSRIFESFVYSVMIFSFPLFPGTKRRYHHSHYGNSLTVRSSSGGKRSASEQISGLSSEVRKHQSNGAAVFGAGAEDHVPELSDLCYQIRN